MHTTPSEVFHRSWDSLLCRMCELKKILAPANKKTIIEVNDEGRVEGYVGPLEESPTRDIDEEITGDVLPNSTPSPDTPPKLQEQSSIVIFLQIAFPFLLAGFGTVCAGLLFDVVQYWPVFQTVGELIIMVPALLGLKGNLEMTLASRLSTHANLGHMDKPKDCLSMVTGNLALIQCQGIVVGFLASVAAILMGLVPNGNFNIIHSLLVCASALVTASFASFILGVVMVGVILISRKCNINPDNVATPIAASLGDLTTLGLLAGIASPLYEAKGIFTWLAPILIIVWYILILPLWVWLAFRNVHTKEILATGWTPVIAAMVISSGAGVILNYAVSRFEGIAVYQPVINGIGGNLVAIQASRLSTSLHAVSSLGTLPDTIKRISFNPIKVFFSREGHSRSARVLMLLVIPGHLIFIYTISFLQSGEHALTAAFICVYLFVAFIQVLLLLYVAYILIHRLWRAAIDPDNSSIPYLTALGDLSGIGLLAAAFYFLHFLGDKVAIVSDKITAEQ